MTQGVDMDSIGPKEHEVLTLERRQARVDAVIQQVDKRLTSLEQRIWQSWAGLAYQPFGVSPTPTPTPTPTPCAMPTLSVLSNYTHCGDPGLVTISLSGITDGMSGTALPITVTATTAATVDITGLSVSYTSPATTGSLSFTPRAGLNNCATPRTINVKVANNCNTGTRGGTNSLVRTFTVVVTQPATPTLNAIANIGPLMAGSANQTVNLSGISPGICNTSGSLGVTATTDNPAVSSIVSTSYTNPASTGSVVVSIGAAGTANITVTVTDSNPAHCGTPTFSRTFQVQVV